MRRVVRSSVHVGPELLQRIPRARDAEATDDVRWSAGDISIVNSKTPHRNQTDVVIRALEERLWAAQLAADVATLDELIADDLLFAGPTGELATKAEDLE